MSRPVPASGRPSRTSPSGAVGAQPSQRIAVTIEDLRTAGSSLAATATALNHLGRELPRGTVVNSGLESADAIRYLAGAWKRALESLGTHCDVVAREVHAAGGAYLDAERRNLHRSGSASPGVTTMAAGTVMTSAGSVRVVSGSRAVLLADGEVAAPANAPEAVKALIAAGNDIRSKPYPAPDVHYDNQNLAQPWPAYDCSGSVSYLLYRAGLRGVDATDSSGLEGYGDPGAGKWVTVYANGGHTFISVAGVVFNTVHLAPTNPGGTGPRWQPGSTVARQIAVNIDGPFAVRHPAGL